MKDAGEPGIDGVKVILKKDGATIAETLTNNGRTYRFGNLPNGTYDIKFEQPDGLKFTTQSKDGPLAADNDSDDPRKVLYRVSSSTEKTKIRSMQV